jgi:iron complex transport system ATP-binding protein
LIPGVEHEIGPEAVVVRSSEPLVVLSSAVAGGGLGRARSIVNLHVTKNFQCARWEAPLAELVRLRSLPSPWIGLLTSAWTEDAEVSADEAHGIAAFAVVTVGLGNPIAAGVTPAAAVSASTINTIVVVDARPAPAAMVNAVITVTEVKTATLMAAGVRCAEGHAATGTSTDAVVIAATERGRRCDFGGPISDLGALVARVTRDALERGVRRWIDTHHQRER